MDSSITFFFKEIYTSALIICIQIMFSIIFHFKWIMRFIECSRQTVQWYYRIPIDTLNGEEHRPQFHRMMGCLLLMIVMIITIIITIIDLLISRNCTCRMDWILHLHPGPLVSNIFADKKSLRIFNFWQDSKKKSLHKKLERWDVTIAKCSQGRLVPRLLTRQSVTSQSVTRQSLPKQTVTKAKLD